MFATHVPCLREDSVRKEWWGKTRSCGIRQLFTGIHCTTKFTFHCVDMWLYYI